MRINNLHLAKVKVDATGEAQRREPAPAPTIDRTAAPVASFHTPAPEFALWLSRVQEEPEIRTEVVARVAGRLVGGHYLTHSCALETATAILLAHEEP